MKKQKKKVLLIHGWGTSSYNSNLKTLGKNLVESTWIDRKMFVKGLKSNFEVRFFNLPGFCGTTEPKEKFYDVEDFTNYLHRWLETRKKKPDIVIGYSFGGVVALDYKIRYSPKIPTVLIAPALKRKEGLWSLVAKKTKYFVPGFITNKLRGWYQTIFSKYYRKGSDFLRNSYDVIARRDTRNMLLSVDNRTLKIIIGDQDTSTPFGMIKEELNKLQIARKVIAGGDHDIAKTHYREILEAILEFSKKH